MFNNFFVNVVGRNIDTISVSGIYIRFRKRCIIRVLQIDDIESIIDTFMSCSYFFNSFKDFWTKRRYQELVVHIVLTGKLIDSLSSLYELVPCLMLISLGGLELDVDEYFAGEELEYLGKSGNFLVVTDCQSL